MKEAVHEPYELFGVGKVPDLDVVDCVRRFVALTETCVDLDAYQIATRLWVVPDYDFVQTALKLVGEVGDVLWYLARVADYLEVPLSRLCRGNPSVALLISSVSGAAADATAFLAASQVSELASKIRMHRRVLSEADEVVVETACLTISDRLRLRTKNYPTLQHAAATNLRKLWNRHGDRSPNYGLAS